MGPPCKKLLRRSGNWDRNPVPKSGPRKCWIFWPPDAKNATSPLPKSNLNRDKALRQLDVMHTPRPSCASELEHEPHKNARGSCKCTLVRFTRLRWASTTVTRGGRPSTSVAFSWQSNTPEEKKGEEKAAFQFPCYREQTNIAARGVSVQQGSTAKHQVMQCSSSPRRHGHSIGRIRRRPCSNDQCNPASAPLAAMTPHRTGSPSASSLTAPVATTPCPSPSCAQRGTSRSQPPSMQVAPCM